MKWIWLVLWKIQVHEINSGTRIHFVCPAQSINLDRWLNRNWRAPASHLDCFHWNFSQWLAKCIKSYEDQYDLLTVCIADVFFFVRKVCHANYRGMVSSVQVEMYHTQLDIKALLLLMELRVRGGICVKNMHLIGDIICTRYYKNSKFHTNNFDFSIKFLAILFVFTQQHPVRNRPLKSAPVWRQNEL